MSVYLPQVDINSSPKNGPKMIHLANKGLLSFSCIYSDVDFALHCIDFHVKEVTISTLLLNTRKVKLYFRAILISRVLRRSCMVK